MCPEQPDRVNTGKSLIVHQDIDRQNQIKWEKKKKMVTQEKEWEYTEWGMHMHQQDIMNLWGSQGRIWELIILKLLSMILLNWWSTLYWIKLFL